MLRAASASKKVPTPNLLGGNSAAITYSSGGGKASKVGSGAFQGRTLDGGSRSDVYGTRCVVHSWRLGLYLMAPLQFIRQRLSQTVLWKLWRIGHAISLLLLPRSMVRTVASVKLLSLSLRRE